MLASNTNPRRCRAANTTIVRTIPLLLSKLLAILRLPPQVIFLLVRPINSTAFTIKKIADARQDNIENKNASKEEELTLKKTKAATTTTTMTTTSSIATTSLATTPALPQRLEIVHVSGLVYIIGSQTC